MSNNDFNLSTYLKKIIAKIDWQSLALVVTAVSALATAVIMQQQTKFMNRPFVIIDNHEVSVFGNQYDYELSFHDSEGIYPKRRFRSGELFEIERLNPPKFIHLINTGNLSAININVDFSYDYRSCIDTINTEYGEKTVSLHKDEQGYDLKLLATRMHLPSLNADSFIHYQYMASGAQKTLTLPSLYISLCELLSTLKCRDYLSKPSKNISETYHLELFPIKLTISYENYVGNKVSKAYKLNPIVSLPALVRAMFKTQDNRVFLDLGSLNINIEEI